RSLHGFQVQLQGSRVVGGSFHRLLAVYYPGDGWVASDVGRTKNFLPPDTLVLAAEGEELRPEEARLAGVPAVPYHREVECRLYRSELLVLDEQPWPRAARLWEAWAAGHRQAYGA